MRVCLASSWAKPVARDGRRIATKFFEENGFLERLRSVWPKGAKVMIIVASPEEYEVNDDRLRFYRESLELSGLDYSELILVDDRNVEAVERLPEMAVVMLLGGHVPTQNAFHKKLRLRERLEGCFDGLVLAYSAGSMNCAEVVYSCPEISGEGLDPGFQRWLSGLGLTRLHILPHFQWIRDEEVDGLRMLEDIAMPDSFKEPILALNDGSYVWCEGGLETIVGDAWWIRDGVMEKV